MVSIPIEKVQCAKDQIEFILQKQNKKITLHQLQKLCGFLNFLGHCVVPGHAFTRRLYTQGKASGATEQYHHLRVTREMRMDLEMWKCFLVHPSAFCRSFIDFDDSITSEKINFYTDASGSYSMGGMCNDQWMIMKWPETFIQNCKPTIQYLEMYALLAGIIAWIHNYKNRTVTIFCDNQNVVNMIKNNSTSCQNCMILVHIFVLYCLTMNVNVTAEYVKSQDNKFADPLSRGDVDLFFSRVARKENEMSSTPTPVPEILLPMENLWLKE